LVDETVFANFCDSIGISIDADAIALLKIYAERLAEWNRKLNLVSRADTTDIWGSHIFHSLLPLSCVAIGRGWRVLDLGTGGGLPGVPIAIARQDLKVTLLDSIRKKSVALENIVAALNINNVKVVCGRAEAVAEDEGFKRHFDVVIARAVASLRDLVKWSIPLARKTEFDGDDSFREVARSGKRHFRKPFLIAMKGGDLESEVNSARAKFKQKEMTVVSLEIKAWPGVSLEEKKLVIVEL
jgi:16S rRNA (guanine(527)-N(7))-methyltransferase RsmG